MTLPKRMVWWRIGAVAACATLMLGAPFAPTAATGETAAATLVGTEVYQWRPDLGGWLDTSKNLIWGYSPSSINNSYAGVYDSVVSWTTGYASLLTNQGFAAEGAIAAQYTNWRLPTLAECQDAYAKGFFAYGPDKFNWDTSPAPGAQGLAYGGDNSWTSTPGTKKDKAKIWVFNPTNGTSGLSPKTYQWFGLAAVRTHVP